MEGELVYHTLIGCSRHKRSFRFEILELRSCFESKS